MDFDEYDYLEQTVENPGLPKGSENGGSRSSGSKRDRSEKSSRHREEGHGDVTESRSKRERSENRDGEKIEKSNLRHSSRDDRERYAERNSSRHRRSPRSSEKDHHRNGRDKEEPRDREERDRYCRERERDRVKERDPSRERDKSRERGNDRDVDRESPRRSSSRSERHRRARETESEVERARSREARDGEREKEREREPEFQVRDRDARRFKDKKEAAEPEADPERDQRAVFAYQMPLKATERDVYEFFSRAGKVRDVRLIMDRNSRRSKGVGYVEFYDAMSVPMAIALSGQPLFGQPVMVKPSEAEKNLVQSTAAAAASGVAGAYSSGDRKVYVGNLHFDITEDQLRQIFEAFGPVELVQLPIDSDTGHCKGFGFVQFAQLEHAKASVTYLNGKLELAGRIIKVSAVSEHNTMQDVGTNAADFDDDDGGGLSLNASSRAMLMQKLDRTGTATSIVGPLGAPLVNGAAPVQPSILPIPGQPALPTPVVPVLPVAEPIGIPSECLLLKNMFDPSTETEPEFDLDIKEDVQEECSNFGVVKHIYVDKNSAGNVYLKFDSVAAASRAQQAMHGRWFARRMITATFMPTLQYDMKFKEG